MGAMHVGWGTTQRPYVEALILLPKYGFGVQVRFWEGVRHLKPLTRGLAFTHCVLRLNPIKDTFNIAS